MKRRVHQGDARAGVLNPASSLAIAISPDLRVITPTYGGTVQRSNYAQKIGNQVA